RQHHAAGRVSRGRRGIAVRAASAGAEYGLSGRPAHSSQPRTHDGRGATSARSRSRAPHHRRSGRRCPASRTPPGPRARGRGLTHTPPTINHGGGFAMERPARRQRPARAPQPALLLSLVLPLLVTPLIAPLPAAAQTPAPTPAPAGAPPPPIISPEVAADR